MNKYGSDSDIKTKRSRGRRAATARRERIWDFGVIPYEIDGNFSGAHKTLFKQVKIKCAKINICYRFPRELLILMRCCFYFGHGPGNGSLHKFFYLDALKR